MNNIPLFKISSDEKDIEAVTKVIRRGSFWADGPEVKEFENKLAQYFGIKYAVTFNSGTSGLHSVLLAYNIKGHEVIVPSFTFISSANSIILAGGKPVFAEVEEDTFGLDFEDVKKRINDNTKAIMIVHYAGCPARDTEKIRALCKEKNLILIEDAAESMGASINGKKVGTFGDAAMFSFCQNKIVPIGEGGVIVTNDETIYEKMKLLRSHGRLEDSEEGYFSNIHDNDYIELGYNYRMPTICAALGISQLNKIDKLIEKRKFNAKLLNQGLSKIDQIALFSVPQGFNHVYQLYSVLLDEKVDKGKFQKYLKSEGIMTKTYFNPIHLKTYYKKKYGYEKGDLPKTEKISERVISFPFYIDMTQEDIEYIIINIKKALEIR